MAEFLKTAINTLDRAQQSINANNPAAANGTFTGFAMPDTYSADGNGLPYSKVGPNQQAQFTRNIITWFLPEIGLVRLFVNPEGITYNHKKLITKDRTKGGFTLQYWGNDLSTLNITGTTASSGIEGINMLYEIYQAEQLAFDNFGLTLAANNASADLSANIANKAQGFLTDTLGGVAGSIVGGVLGLDSPNNTLATKNIPSLAQLAFTIEMYYMGEVYRGYFENFTVNERANNFLFDYNMNFVVTQKRGYRTNYFPFHRSPAFGPSTYNTPHSFSGEVIR